MKTIAISNTGWTLIGPSPLLCVPDGSSVSFITSATPPALPASGVLVDARSTYKFSETSNIFAMALGDSGTTTIRYRTLQSSDFQPTSGPNPLLACANRGQLPNTVQIATAGNLMKVESRKCMTMGGSPISELRLSYANFYILVNNGTEIFPGNPVNLAVAIEINGVTRQVTFTQYAQATGQTTTTINSIAGYVSLPNGATDVVSDSIYPWQFGLTSFPEQMPFFIREMRTVTALNNTFVRHTSSTETGEISVYCDPTVVTTSQLLSTGALTQQTGGATANCSYGPTAIIGRAIGTPDIAVLLVGDSLIDGTGDNGINSPAGSGNGDAGFCMRGLWGLNGRNVPVSKMTVGGSSIYNVANSHAGRRAYWKYFTHALVGYGSNDGVGVGETAQTAAQVMANLTTFYYLLKAGDSNIRHVATNSIINRVATTDGGVTTANQTPVSGFANEGAFRQPLNALDHILDPNNECQEVWADSAYRSKEQEASLQKQGCRSHIHERAYRNKPLTAEQEIANLGRSGVRVRVEHILATSKPR